METLSTETLMELMDREREHGRMLQEEEMIHSLMDRAINEALEDDMKSDFYTNYKNLDSVKITIGDLALVTGYTIPDWLMKKAEEVKQMKEEK